MTGLHILFLAIKELWTFVNFITREILPGWYAYVASYLEVFQINVSHFTARLWLLFTTSNFKEIIRWREATQAMLKVYFRTVKNHNQNLKLERFRKIENRRSYSRLTSKTHDNEHEGTGENTDIHCVKSVHIQSFSSVYFPAFRLFVSVQMWENMNQKNSEYGHVSCSDYFRGKKILEIKGFWYLILTKQ